VNGKTPTLYHKKHLSLSWDGRVLLMNKKNRKGNDGTKKSLLKVGIKEF
jgi:hypothetical protein